MKNVLKALALVAALATAGTASATVDSVSPGYGYTYNSITYSHHALGASSSATLDIYAYDIDYSSGERDLIEAFDAATSSWLTVGYLTGANNTYSTTSFNLAAGLLDDVATGLSVRVSPNSGWAVQTITSTLTTTAAVPEGDTYALFAAGLGVLGWIGRRRKTQA